MYLLFFYYWILSYLVMLEESSIRLPGAFWANIGLTYEQKYNFPSESLTLFV